MVRPVLDTDQEYNMSNHRRLGFGHIVMGDAVRLTRTTLAAAIMTMVSVAMPAVVSAESPATRPADDKGPWLRVNQVGYMPADRKIAILSSDDPLSGSFSIGTLKADIGPDQGAWGPFRHNYRLDFSSLSEPGHYELRFGKESTQPVVIGPTAYAELPAQLLSFMRLQRCGDNPVTGKKCHQQDARDTTTGEQLDLVGGWHDAADRIKHQITTTYCVAALFLAGAKEEARYGAQLVKKIHPRADVIYVQIADDRDHMPPAGLWHEDKSNYGWGPGGPRSAWPATTQPAGPKYQNKSSGFASLAGRASAAMTLAGDLDTARSMYKLACEHPGCAMSVPVKAPHYYGESTFWDDLEWGATELYLATKDAQYLKQAIEFADHAGDNAWMGQTRHGHYEFFPYVNLAHWRLYPHVDREVQARLAGYYRSGLERIRTLAERNPYRLGTPLVWCSTNDVIALATQAILYEQMTGDQQFRELATEARDWIFGRNPWGVSFVIGVPANGVCSRHPHHMFYRLANTLPVGGLVDGPVYKDINDSLKFGAFGDDAYARFQSDIGVFHDCYGDFSTNEPIIDGTVSLLLLVHQWPK
jgi:hypothetical protein